MKSWSTLFLALVTLGLLAYLYFLGIESPGTKERMDRDSRVLFIDPDKVDRLEMVAGETTVVLTRSNAGLWDIEKPISYPADLSNVRQVLGDFEFARRRDTLSRSAFQNYEKALDSMGLKTPKATVRIRQGKEISTLAIGNETARTGQFYALVSDGRKEELVIIDRGVESAALRELAWFRKREVFDFQTPLVTGVLLRKGEQETELVRTGDLWAVTKPLACPADETQVISYFAELLAGKVADFVADGPGNIVGYGLSTPTMVLEIRSGDKSQQLRIGQPVPGKDQVYAQINGRPHVVGLQKAYVDKLAELLTRTRDQRVLVFQDPFEFDSVRMKGKGLDLSFKQTGSRTWRLETEPEHIADTQLVNAFLSSLRDLRASQLLPKSDAELAKWGLEPAATVLTFSRKADVSRKDVPPGEIRFSAPRKGKIYASTPRLPFIAELPETALSLVPVVPSDWYEKKVSLLRGLADFHKITWQRPGGSVVLERGADGAWPATLQGRPVDGNVLTRQQKLLEEMAVAAWVPVKESDFAKPRFTLVLEAKDGTSCKADFALLGNPQEYRGRVRGTREMFVIRSTEPQLLENPPLAEAAPAPAAPAAPPAP